MSRSISYLKNLQGCRSMSKIVGLTTLQQIYVRQEANCNWYYIVIVTVGRWHCLHRGRFIWEDRAGCRDKITLFSPNGQTDENNCQFQNTYMLAAPAELNKVYSSMVLCCLIGGWFIEQLPNRVRKYMVNILLSRMRENSNTAFPRLWDHIPSPNRPYSLITVFPRL